MESNVVSRVTNYPIVSSAIDQVTSVYERAKESNKLVKYTLETGESCVKTVSSTAAPVVNKFEKPIATLNNVACDQLGKLEQKYPIITKPTEEVLDETKHLYERTLKPSVDRATGVVKYTYDSYNGAKTYSAEKINGVKQYGVDTVNNVKTYATDTVGSATTYGLEKVNAALESPCGQTVTKRLDVYLTAAENCVEKYLPDGEVENPGHEIAKEVGSEKVTVARLTNLGSKVRQRMFSRAMKDLQNIQTRSKETLDKLSFTVDLIQYAKSNIDSVNQSVHDGISHAQTKLWQTWEEISAEQPETKEEESEDSKKFERRAIRIARHLALRLRKGFESALETTTHLPDAAREQINQAKKYSEELYDSFKKVSKIDDLSQMVLDEARAKVSTIHDTLAYLTDAAVNSRALSWLGWNSGKEEKMVENTDVEMEEMKEENSEGINEEA